MNIKSLKAKISFIGFLFYSFIFLFFSLTFYYLLSQSIKKNISDTQFQMISQIAFDIENNLQIRISALERVSKIFSKKNIKNQKDLNLFLLEREGTGTLFNGLFIADLKGRLLVQAHFSNPLDLELIFEEKFVSEIHKTQKTVISTPFIEKNSNMPSIIIGTPIFNSQKEIAGIIGGAMDLFQNELFQEMNNIHIGKKGYMYLFDKEKRLIVHWDKKRLLTKVPDGANKGIDMAVNGFEGTVENQNSYGLKALTTFKKLKMKDWILGSNYPIEEAYESVEKLKEIFYLIFLSSLLFFLSYYLLIRKYLFPLSNLTDHFKKLPETNWEQRYFQYSKKDEIGYLSEAFNQMIDKLQTSEEEIRKLSNAVNQSPVSIVVTDINGKITFVNPSFEDITGYPIEEAMGKNPNILKSGKHDDEFYQEMWNTISNGKTWQGEICNKKKDESLYWEDATISPVKNNEGEITHYIGVKRDISKEKETEEKLRIYTLTIEKELTEKRNALLNAQKIQRNLNPQQIPVFEKFNISAFYLPSEELGGDFFDVRVIGEKLVIILGDCEGHGLEAALDSVLTKAICDRYYSLFEIARTDIFLQAVNNDILEYFKGEKFLTLFAAVIDLETNELFYSSANAEIPFLIRKNKAFLLERPEGFHIGFEANMNFERKSIRLMENDKLAFYSDSVREMMSKDLVPFGLENLENIFSRFIHSLQTDLALFLSEVKSFYGRFPLEDDTTLVFIEYKGGSLWKKEVESQKEINELIHHIFELFYQYNFPEQKKTPLLEFLKLNLKTGVKINFSIHFKKLWIKIESYEKKFSVFEIENQSKKTNFELTNSFHF
ncbi:MAG TPA: hypothetical protein DHW82_07175 [Spirochaetia bacterium]|nr:MAG: hypothetical protein A2Y41_10985 [Spirochaetes bacterium GWB1_36_13]HCL56775.1 hypothetical protein [Spirochaetia bacterium]